MSRTYLSKLVPESCTAKERAMKPTSLPQIQGLYERFSHDVKESAKTAFGDDADGVLDALAQPVRTYYVRCNTLRISPNDLARNLRSRGINVEEDTRIPEAVGMTVQGPFGIPNAGREVVVDKHTAESVLQGANVYAPGILNCTSMHVGDEVVISSELGDVIAAGKALMSENDVLVFRKGLAVQIDRTRFAGPHIRDLPEYNEGLLYPQSLAAMATVRVLDPKPGETIVDMSCAPGGKLSHISQLTGNAGRVFGFDRNRIKIGQTRETLTRLRCTNVVLSIHDSRYLHDDFLDLKADRVLIDPPCSALGLRPKVYDLTTAAGIRNLADYQKQFVKSACEITKPGGVIVYSVCTFTVEECEKVVDFAEHECGLRVTEQTPFIASRGLSSIVDSGSLCQRFRPDVHEIGYFIARFER